MTEESREQAERGASTDEPSSSEIVSCPIACCHSKYCECGDCDTCEATINTPLPQYGDGGASRINLAEVMREIATNDPDVPAQIEFNGTLYVRAVDLTNTVDHEFVPWQDDQTQCGAPVTRNSVGRCTRRPHEHPTIPQIRAENERLRAILKYVKGVAQDADDLDLMQKIDEALA